MRGEDAIRELGPALRERREQLGLSLDEVAIATRIPVAHLKAIELERPQDLPEGPYAQAYVRVLREHLQIQGPSSEVVQEAERQEVVEVSGPIVPLAMVRAVAGVSALAVVSTVAVLSWQRFVPERPEVVVVPDQKLVVTARRSERLRAVVDGQVVHDGVLPGGQAVELLGHERVEVTVASTAAFVVEWNGEVVVPQGLQDHPRTLVFVDDVGPPPPAPEAPVVQAPAPPADGEAEP